MDSYAFPVIDDPISAGYAPPVALGPQADLAFRPLQLPSVSPPQVVVLRARAHEGIAGSTIHVSGNNSSFTVLGAQDVAGTGGILEEALADTGRPTLPSPIVTGPKFEPLNDDIVDVLDLSGDEPSWRGGRQIMVINDEVFFVRSFAIVDESSWAASTAYSLGDFVEPTTPNGFRYKCISAGTTSGTQPTWPTTLDGTVTDGTAEWECRRKAWVPQQMLGSQYGSTAASHAIDDETLIADTVTLEVFENPILFLDGEEIFFKSQPRTAARDVDLSTITSESLTISDP
jgi:hypothetical protein